MSRTCDELAKKGTGVGPCDRPLDQHGNCDRAADHDDPDDETFDPDQLIGPDDILPTSNTRP